MGRTGTIFWGAITGLVVGAFAASAGLMAGGEDMGPWFFARLMDGAGGFIVPGRSYLYQLSVRPFLEIAYPWSLGAEMMVRSAIAGAMFGFAFWRLIGPRFGLIWFILLAPALLITGPVTQVYALALVCVAWALRRENAPWWIPYLLLFGATLFRSNYQIILAIVALWDLVCLWRRGPSRTTLRGALPGLGILVAVIVASNLAGTHQADHKWNNYFYISDQWLPYDAKIVGPGHFSQAIAYNVMERDGPPADGPFDTWFMHRKLFGDARTPLAMVLANPAEWTRHILRNLRGMTTTVTDLTGIGHGMYLLAGKVGLDHRIVTAMGFPGLILLGLWFFVRVAKGPDGRSDLPILIGLIGVAATALLVSGSKDRFFHPLLAVFAPAAYLAAKSMATRLDRPMAPILLTGLIFLTQGWMVRLPPILEGALNFPATIERRSQTEAIAFLNAHGAHCRGILSVDAMRLATFSALPPSMYFDVFEIPPFGTLGDGTYDGLRPSRIDCLDITPALANKLPPHSEPVTNLRVRWENYIRPYMEHLLANGASRFEVGGRIFVLARPNGSEPRSGSQ